LSPALVEDLTAHRSAAIGAILLKRADIALVAVVHALVIDAFGTGKSEPCLKLRCSRTTYRSAETCKGFAEIEKAFTSMARRLPEDSRQLFTYLLGWSQKDLLELLALMAALSVDAVQRKGDRPDVPRLVHASTLASALDLDMTEWFEPTAENYFGRVTRAQILADLDDAKGTHAPSLDKLKKTELAARAESIVSGSGWLPKPLRSDSVCVSAEIALAAE
jgi:ParB family chromosome partitioning protein